MNSNKVKQSVLLLMVALCLFGFKAFSQPDGQEGPRHEQRDERPQHFRQFPFQDLTDAQKTQIEKLNLNFQKQTLQTKNQIGEKEAQLHTAITQDKADMKKINALVDDISQLRASIQKERIKTNLEIRDLLTDEQKVLFNQRTARDMHSPDQPHAHHPIR